MSDYISRQEAIDLLEKSKEKDAKGNISTFYNTIIQNNIEAISELPSAELNRSLWFRIGEICVDESKGFISAGRAVKKIRELLREAERWEVR